jgi:hypothetical protein
MAKHRDTVCQHYLVVVSTGLVIASRGLLAKRKLLGAEDGNILCEGGITAHVHEEADADASIVVKRLSSR